MNKLLFNFVLMSLIPFNLAAEQCSTTVNIIFQQQGEKLEINYHSNQKLAQLKLAATALTTNAFIPQDKNRHSSSSDNRLTIINNNNSVISVTLQPLSQYINATYAPYISLDKKHGVHLAAIKPIAYKKSVESSWQTIDNRCLRYFTQHAISGEKSPIADEKNFIQIDLFSKYNVVKLSNNFNFASNESLPNWIANLLTDNFPIFFEFYKANIKVERNEPLNIMVSFEQSKSPFFQGDVHDNNTFVLRFGGKQYQDSNPLATQQILQFVAHEVFHIWSEKNTAKTSWLHEGSADFAANLAKYKLNMINKSEFIRQNNLQKLKCLMWYGQKTIPSNFAWPGRYSCGHAFLSNLIGEQNFFNYWGKQLTRTKGTDLSIFSDSILSDNRAALKLITGSTVKHQPSKQKITLSFLQLIGEITIDNKMSNGQLRSTVFRHLMAQACDGQISFETRSEQIRMYYQKKCHPSFKQATGYITHLNDISMQSQEHELLASYLTTCSRDHSVTVRGDKFTAILPCKIDQSVVDKLIFQ